MAAEPKPPVSGTMLQLLAMLLAGAVAFAVVQGRGEQNSLDLEDHEDRIRVLEQVNARLDARLARIELQLEGLTEAINGAKE